MFVRFAPLLALILNCAFAAPVLEETTAPPQPPSGKTEWEARVTKCTIAPDKEIVGVGYIREGHFGALEAYGSIALNGEVMVIAEISLSGHILLIGRVPTSATIFVRESKDRWIIYRMRDLIRKGDRQKLGKYLLERAGITEQDFESCKRSVDFDKLLFERGTKNAP